MMVEEKGTEYVVLCNVQGTIGYQLVGVATGDSKEGAIQSALRGGEWSEDKIRRGDFRAVPNSSWKDEFVVETEPRVRRKR